MSPGYIQDEATQLASQLRAAGYVDSSKALMNIAIEAWRKYPDRLKGGGARMGHVRSALFGHAYTLMQTYQPRAMTAAIEELLRDADETLAAKRAKMPVKPAVSSGHAACGFQCGHAGGDVKPKVLDAKPDPDMAQRAAHTSNKAERLRKLAEAQSRATKGRIEAVKAARALDLVIEGHEASMEHLAVTLPVWKTFGAGVRGFGSKGLGMLVGETAGICPNGIGEFRTVSGLWRYFGLAVLNGQRQQARKGRPAEEEKYSPAKRSEAWVVSQFLLFAQVRAGEKDEEGNPVEDYQALGKYGEIYIKRKAYTWPRIEATAHLDTKHPDRWFSGRCVNDARRVMLKALLKDLWVAWRACDRAAQAQIAT